MAGPPLGRIFTLGTAPLTIGRQSANTIQLTHESVSRHHCALSHRDGMVSVEDFGSLCGTFVNGVAVRYRELGHGDFLKVGESLFVVLLHEDAAPEIPAETPEAQVVVFETTQELKVDQAFYLQPERVRQALLAGEQVGRQLSALLEISSEIRGQTRVDSLLECLSKLLLRAVPARGLAVMLADGGVLSLAYREPGDEDAPVPSRTLCQQVLESQVAILSRDVGSDPALDSADSLDGGRAVLCVPLTAADRQLGVIYAEAPAGDAAFRRDHLEVTTAAAAIAAPALGQLRSLERLKAENRRLRQAQLGGEIVGESSAMRRVMDLVFRVAASDLTVLVLGESGTGKELIAKAVHRGSSRRDRAFVAINCATLSETLLESELFGHEKGAFTGAVSRKLGQFELAHEGTLFLDEIGEMPVVLQARLLRALENREIQRVGGTRPLPVDVRIVAATNRDLAQAIARGSFREDLYHRINVFSVEMPPLRERGDDVSLLASHFTARSAERQKRAVAGLTADTHLALRAYSWPGNVRELRNAMERAVVLSNEELLRPEDLPESVLECAASRQPEPGSDYHDAVARAKREILQRALNETGGHAGRAAKLLRLNRTYLYRLLHNLDMSPGS